MTLATGEPQGVDRGDSQRKGESVAAQVEAIQDCAIPYLGLRPFEPEDSEYFWGREVHKKDLCSRLARQRFIAVVGLSGAGKSSLVRAGMIPELWAGRLSNATSDWLIAVMTPGNAPTARLFSALTHGVAKHAGNLSENDQFLLPDNWQDIVGDELWSDDDGLVRAVNRLGLPISTQVLLVVDQFEELFRFDQLSRFATRAKKDEAQEFVRKLLAARTSPDSKIYVVITMRSEFLGHCASYAGLAEAVNDGIYLTPRLREKELRLAISVPAQLQGQKIEEDLMTRLVNDVVNDQDQLPVLQHALMRCWLKRQPTEKFDEALYKRIIGNSNALDNHANRIMSRLSAKQQKIAMKLFKRITKMGSKEGLRSPEDSGVRDAATLTEICDQIVEHQSEVVAVIEEFRKPNRAFLRPPYPEPLTADSIIDITHESLIRKWETLRSWVTQEENAASAYRKLVDAAEAYFKRLEQCKNASIGQIATIPQPLLPSEIANFDQYADEPWNENWAERYGGKYKQAEELLELSRKRWKDVEEETKRLEDERRNLEEHRRIKEIQDQKEAAELRESMAQVARRAAEAEQARQKAEAEAALRAAEAAEARQKAEAEAALRAAEVAETRQKAAAEKAVAAGRTASMWRKFAIFTIGAAIFTIGAALLTYFFVTRKIDSTKNQMVAIFRFTHVALSPDLSMSKRVPAALSSLILKAKQPAVSDLKLDVPLDQWELFSAVRKPMGAITKEDPVGAITKGDGKIDGVGGISIDSRGQFVAIADVKKRKVLVFDRKHVFIDSADFAASRVRFHPTEPRLIAASNPEEAEKSWQSKVQIFDVSNVKPLLKPPAIVKLTSDHDGVAALAFAGPSDEFAVATMLGQVLFYHCSKASDGFMSCIDDGKPISPNEGQSLLYTTVDRESKFLALLYTDGSIWVVDLNKKVPPKILTPRNSPPSVAAAFSDDGECIVVGTADNHIKAFGNSLRSVESSCDVDQALPSDQLSDPNLISTVAMRRWDNHKWTIAAGTRTRYAYVFDNQEHSPRALMHQEPVTWVSLAENGQIVTASDDQKARLFDTRTGQEMLRVPHQDKVYFAQLDLADGELISASADGALLWTHIGDPMVPRSEYSLSDLQSSSCSPVAAASNDEVAITCGGQTLGAAQKSPTGWTSAQQALNSLAPDKKDDKDDVGAVNPMIAFSSNGDTLAWMHHHLNDGKGWIHVRYKHDLQKSMFFEDSGIMPGELALSPNGDLVAVASVDSGQKWSLHVYDLDITRKEPLSTPAVLPITEGFRSDGKPSRSAGDSRNRAITALAVADDGSIAAGSSDGAVLLWNCHVKTPTRDFQKVVVDDSIIITALAFSNADKTSGKQLFIGSSDGYIAVGNIGADGITGVNETRREAEATFFALSEHNKWLAAVQGNRVTVFSKGEFGYDSTAYFFEPGVVQALVFGVDATPGSKLGPELNTFVLHSPLKSGIAGRPNMLIEFSHNTSAFKHAKSICGNQPKDNGPDNAPEDWVTRNWRDNKLDQWPFGVSKDICGQILTAN